MLERLSHCHRTEIAVHVLDVKSYGLRCARQSPVRPNGGCSNHQNISHRRLPFTEKGERSTRKQSRLKGARSRPKKQLFGGGLRRGLHTPSPVHRLVGLGKACEMQARGTPA